jgi:fructose-1-phosphate kinase PfkB-like protein
MTAAAQIEATFRREHGRILAALISRLGDFDLAEDALQEALVNALEQWERDGIPRNPGAWLLTVAGHRAVDRLRRAATHENKAKKSVWLDTSGAALKTALGVRGVNIKVNAAELGEALGSEISNVDLAISAGRKLLAQGISSIAITLGKDGAVLIVDSGVWAAHPPEIEVISTVGSGDAFLGGLAFALEQGHSPKTALRYGIAAGATNALHFGGGIVETDVFDKFLDATTLQ